jgi:hypothetical protein
MAGTWNRAEPHTRCSTGCGAAAVATRQHYGRWPERVCALHLLARGWVFEREDDLHPRPTTDEEEPERRALVAALRSAAPEDDRLPIEPPYRKDTDA